MTQSQQLFEENIEWAKAVMQKCAKKRGWPQYLSDDISQAALLGLWSAASQYRQDIGNFRNYAWIRVLGAVLDYLRENGWICPRSDRHREPLGPELAHVDPEPEQIDTLELAQHLFAMLADQRTRRIMELYFCEGKIMMEIAGELGISQTRVHRLIQKGIADIKHAMSTRHTFRIRTEALEPQLKMGDFVCAKPTPLRALTIGDCVQIRLRGHTNSHLAKVQMAPLEGDLWMFVNSGHQERVYAAEIAEISRLTRVE